MQNENDIDNPVTHLADPFTMKAACREYSDNEYIEYQIPEFVTCKKCINWYYHEYLKVKNG